MLRRVLFVLVVVISFPLVGTGWVNAVASTDAVDTAYGSVGKWMIGSNGQPANWLGLKHNGKSLIEPINVIILDRKSTTTAEAISVLDTAMTRSGYPARGGHSVGYSGYLAGILHGQRPTGGDQAFSDDWHILPNNHGRVFGPAPAVGGGFVWSASFSREKLSWFQHVYVSFAVARNALADALQGAGYTRVGSVDLVNSVDSATTTTGDHDGSAVVLQR